MRRPKTLRRPRPVLITAAQCSANKRSTSTSIERNSSLFALRSSLFALRSSLFALRSSLFALRSSLFAAGRWRSPTSPAAHSLVRSRTSLDRSGPASSPTSASTSTTILYEWEITGSYNLAVPHGLDAHLLLLAGVGVFGVATVWAMGHLAAVTARERSLERADLGRTAGP